MQTTLLRSAKHLVWGGGLAVRVPQICLTQNLICFVSKNPIPNFTTLELPLLEEK